MRGCIRWVGVGEDGHRTSCAFDEQVEVNLNRNGDTVNIVGRLGVMWLVVLGVERRILDAENVLLEVDDRRLGFDVRARGAVFARVADAGRGGEVALHFWC